MNTDTIKDWLARKTELAQKAYKGPWTSKKSIHHGGDYRFVEIDDKENYTTLELFPQDANFIADSRTTTPLALEIARLAVECLEEAHAEFERVHKVKDYNTTFSNTLQQIQTLIES